VSIGAVVLAAGSSRRLGEPKQLVRLREEALVERAVRVCLEAGCEPVMVVLGASADLVRKTCSFQSAVVVENERWEEGMGSSLRVGVSALGTDVDGVVVTTCDMPAVSPEHLRKLTRTGETTASSYAGRRGVPAYFPRGMFGQLLELHGDAGARELLKDARVVELVDGELDVDTLEDLARARELYG
jgi:molybdenum cofactor cytidylyltransferase